MNHQHFKAIGSTQNYLLESKLEANTDYLVSCEHQTAGYGQHGRTWDSFSEGLCFSFTLHAHEKMSLTSLEIACLIHQYFMEHHNIKLKLKWPNDILTTSGRKAGGIIIHNKNDNGLVIVGVGLNYFHTSTPEYTTPYGFLFDKGFAIDKKEEAKKIYDYILNHRFLKSETILSYWNKHCYHLKKNVKIVDKKNEVNGIFAGVGDSGEAIIEINGIQEFIYSGSIILG